ncbi:MAG: hypothetical protein CM15mP32_5860 [Flavobacteriaceae bacterium]|nr:MAG: hypothetical protein CM15mP32_5860 [Flavobacteriaceae bacterium]
MRYLFLLIGALICVLSKPSKTNQNQITFSDEFLSSAVIYEANIRQFTEEVPLQLFRTISLIYNHLE